MFICAIYECILFVQRMYVEWYREGGELSIIRCSSEIGFMRLNSSWKFCCSNAWKCSFFLFSDPNNIEIENGLTILSLFSRYYFQIKFYSNSYMF